MLHDRLKNLENYPFHMPGHKRNNKFGISGSEIDITEIESFDNLHSPSGIILQLEKQLSDFYSSKYSFISTGGSTCCILAAIFALCEEGDEIILARNCHRSVYHACEIRNLKTHFINANFIEELGCYGSIKQDDLNSILACNPHAKAIVITSPTYDGITSKIKTNVPLIVDAAHGAHFPFGNFPQYPHGDIVISSLHKTLPCLTQTAVVNVYNEKFKDRVKKFMDIFETTSPSYVLMNSISISCEYLLSSKKDFQKLSDNLDNLYKMPLSKLEFKIFDDKSKIIVSCSKTNITGVDLANILRKKYKIECEYASVNYVNLISTVADEKYAFEKLSNALKEIDKSLITATQRVIPKFSMPTIECHPSKIDSSEETLLENAYGKISAEIISSYPPGGVIINIGERYTKEIIDYIQFLNKNGICILSSSAKQPLTVLTKKE